MSAFGIQPDACFPFRVAEPEASLKPLVPDGNAAGPKLRRTIRMVGGRPLYSADCYLPPGPSLGHRHPPTPHLHGTDHSYDRRPEVIELVVSLLSPGKTSGQTMPRRR